MKWKSHGHNPVIYRCRLFLQDPSDLFTERKSHPSLCSFFGSHSIAKIYLLFSTLSYPDSLISLSAAISILYLSNAIATCAVCLSGRCDFVLFISVGNSSLQCINLHIFVFCLFPACFFSKSRSEDRSVQILFFSMRHLSQHDFVSDKPFHQDCLQKDLRYY